MSEDGIELHEYQNLVPSDMVRSYENSCVSFNVLGKSVASS